MANKDGISQLIDAPGRVVRELGIGETGVLTWEYHLAPLTSGYARFGRWLELAFFLILMPLAALVAGRRSRA
ncbi:MAG: hypothetical protein AB1331_01320 [Bacillota bacterium]